MDIFKNIKHNYGQQVLQLARKLEKTATQLASWKNHLTFNHQCKRLGVMPPSLRLHTNVQGQAAHQILTTAQKKLTTVRIDQCHECLRRLHITHQHLTATLASSLPPQDFTNLTDQIHRQAELTFQRTKDRQRTKHTNLITPRPRAPPYRTPDDQGQYPFRPIVSGRDSITAPISKHLAHILTPITIKTPYQVQDSLHLKHTLSQFTIPDTHILTSFDITNMYPSIPRIPAIAAFRRLLEQDHTLKQRTSMTIDDIISL
jgi:hypothetical protein